MRCVDPPSKHGAHFSFKPVPWGACVFDVTGWPGAYYLPSCANKGWAVASSRDDKRAGSSGTISTWGDGGECNLGEWSVMSATSPHAAQNHVEYWYESL